MNRRTFVAGALAVGLFGCKKRERPSTIAKETHYPYTDWWLHRPARDYGAVPAVSGASSPDDLALVKRLLAAYRRTFKESHYGGPGIWKGFFLKWHGASHREFMSGTPEAAAMALRDPSSNELHYGFDDTRLGIVKALEENAAERSRLAAISKMCLLTLAEAVGASRIENPESPKPLSAPPTETLLQSIDPALGIRIDFPNPFPNEHGLSTERGIASFRAVQSLYQAYRIKMLLSGVKNPAVLEIGAGTGRTAYYCSKMGLKNYTIVDLPFTAISQGYFLGRVLGEEAVVVEGERAKRHAVKLLSPDSFLGGRSKFDLVVNVDSMTEIPTAIGEQYWKEIKSRARMLLSINHETNEKTMAEIARTRPTRRFPYWMRRGYSEELYVL
jgi:hypothetical protein